MASFTPGWNDPPPLGSEGLNAKTPSARALFNRRVGLPQEASSAGAKPPPLPTTPTPPTSLVQPASQPAEVTNFIPQVSQVSNW